MPSTFKEPLYVTTSRRFRQGLINEEKKMLNTAAFYWFQIEKEFKRDIEKLADKIQRDIAAGRDVRISNVLNMNRYQSMMNQLQANYGILGDGMGKLMQQSYKDVMKLGTTAAATMGSFVSGVAGVFDLLPQDQINTLIGVLREGAPLEKLLLERFEEDYNQTNLIGRQLLKQVSQGLNPREIAKISSEVIYQDLNYLLLLSRDQQIRAYRTALLETYRQAGPDVVRGFKRIAAKNPRTCWRCLALDGKVYTLDEEPELHPQDRCAFVPVVVGYPEPAWQDGRAYFENLNPEDQLATLGKKRFEMYKQGVPLENMVDVTDHPIWGPSLGQKRLNDISTKVPRSTSGERLPYRGKHGQFKAGAPELDYLIDEIDAWPEGSRQSIGRRAASQAGNWKGVNITTVRNEAGDLVGVAKTTRLNTPMGQRYWGDLQIGDYDLAQKFVEINDFATMEAGWGRELMQDVLDQQRRAGRGIVLRSGQDAEGFYRRLGFIQHADDPSVFYMTPEQVKDAIVHAEKGIAKSVFPRTMDEALAAAAERGAADLYGEAVVEAAEEVVRAAKLTGAEARQWLENEILEAEKKVEDLKQQWRRATDDWRVSWKERDRIEAEWDAAKAEKKELAKRLVQSDRPMDPTQFYHNGVSLYREEYGAIEVSDKVAETANEGFKSIMGMLDNDAYDVWEDYDGPFLTGVAELKGRAHFSSMDMLIHLDKSDTIDVAIHEFGHWLEEVQPDIRNAVIEWRDKRIAESGEKAPTWLGRGFNESEVAYRDKFLDPYIGKIYPGNRGTEVFSMGVQMMYNDPLKLAREDPEFFDLIWSILKGTIKKEPTLPDWLVGGG